MRFEIATRSIVGHLAFLLDMQSSGRLEARVADYIRRLEAGA